MIDAYEVFRGLRRQFRAESAVPPCLNVCALVPMAARLILHEWYGVPARISVDRTPSGNFFSPHPNPGQASPRSWALVIPVRCGGLYDGNDNEARIAERAHWSQSERSRRDVMMGFDIVDLVAVSLDLKRIYGRLNGLATVLGSPQDPELAFDRHVRLYSSISSWVQDWFAGVVMIGDDAENLAWLRRCEGGIVVDDVTSGQALHKRLKRAYDGPAVLVAA